MMESGSTMQNSVEMREPQNGKNNTNCSNFLPGFGNRLLDYNLLNENINNLIEYVEQNCKEDIVDSDNEDEPTIKMDETNTTDAGDNNAVKPNSKDVIKLQDDCTKSDEEMIVENSNPSSPLSSDSVIETDAYLSSSILIDSDLDSDDSFYNFEDPLDKNKIIKKNTQYIPRIRVRQDLMPKPSNKEDKQLCGITISFDPQKHQYTCGVVDVKNFKKKYGNEDLKALMKKPSFKKKLYSVYRKLIHMKNEGKYSLDELAEHVMDNIDKVLDEFESYRINKKAHQELVLEEMRIAKIMAASLAVYNQNRMKKIEAKKISKSIKKRHWCGLCREKSTFQCCTSTSYCSTRCQEADWAKHQTICNQLNMKMDLPKLKSNPLNRKLLTTGKNRSIIIN